MRVAFVHDYLTQFGGAERVLSALRPLYPEAPIYTSIYDRRAIGAAFDDADVRTTWLQRLPGASVNFRALLPLYPRAFEALDLRAFDLIISSTTSFAKGVCVRDGAMHMCYMNTPTRFVWYPQEYAMEIAPWIARPALALALPALRRWDYAAAQRPHHIVANSRNVAQRIKASYGRDSDVVHCPADVERFAPRTDVGDYYLVVARLLPYKRVQLAIEACASLRAPLVIVGVGPDERRLRSIANSGVTFAGRVDDAARKVLFARARAVIVPGIEDFGLVPIEAAAAGRPTVAFASGGALETVVEGETGIFFREATARSLAESLRSLDPRRYEPQRLVAHAADFSPERFRARLSALIQRYMQ